MIGRFFGKLDRLIRVAVDKILPKNLTIRYVAALIALAALAISGQILIQNTLVRLSVTFLVMVLEGLYVFRPAVESLYDALRIRSDFLGRMGHEMRNPLNSILGMTHLLSQTSLTERQKKYLSILQKSSAGLLDVLNNLLDFSSIESGIVKMEKIPFDFYKLLERVIDLAVFGAHSNGIDLILDLDPNVPIKLVGDPVRLQQVLSNLLGNAVKFTKKGEVILKIQLHKKLEDVWIDFSVIDTGVGIVKSKINKIFDAFVQEDSTVRRCFGGTGLGLTISKDLVSNMGGSLCVESKKNQGSRFYFTLPFRIAEELSVETSSYEPKIGSYSAFIIEPEKPNEAVPSSPLNNEWVHDPRSLKILAVDDSLDNQFLVQAYLKSLPYQLTFADHGGIAVEKFKEGQFDLVLMDLQMPEMDGYTATQLIREWEQKEKLFPTPVIAVSAHGQDSSSDQYRKARFSSYLLKPIAPNQLRQAIIQNSQHIHGTKAFHGSPSFSENLLGNFSGDEIAMRELASQLAALAPKYLIQRQIELLELRQLAEAADFKKIQSIAHRLKGNAKSYGFEELGTMGGKLEVAAQNQKIDQVRLFVQQMEAYLKKQDGGFYGVRTT